MQKLFVKEKDKDGKTGLRSVHIIRSWQESDGKQIYLHHNGIYGYKDGSPIKNVEEFGIINDPHQKKLAEAWWDRSGKVFSEKYHADAEKAMEARQAGIEGVTASTSDLDAAQYVRRLITNRKKDAWSEPLSWFECAPNGRPEWWGKANIIEIGDYRYKRIDTESVLPAGDEGMKDDADSAEKMAADNF